MHDRLPIKLSAREYRHCRLTVNPRGANLLSKEAAGRLTNMSHGAQETPKGSIIAATDSPSNAIQRVIGYHQETKHHFNRYARALGYMDWANQPNPFRRYEGAPLVPLPILTPDEEPCSPAYDDLYQPGSVDSRPITIRTVSRFFEYALALSAWKEAGGTRWALRSNPSSGNLHPTEGYLLIDGLAGLPPAPGLYHYAPKEHALERRADLSQTWFADVIKPFPPGAFFVAFTSIHWRESWKYGERAFRYCQHDAGHAIGAARIAAATLGWKMVVLDDLGDDQVAGLLGIDRDEDYPGVEREYPDCVAVVWSPTRDRAGPAAETRGLLPLDIGEKTAQAIRDTIWYGKANRLSREKPDPWEIIDVVSAASWKPATNRGQVTFSESAPSAEVSSRRAEPVNDSLGRPLAGRIIRQRRSALAFDGATHISADRFWVMLSRVLPRADRSLQDRPMPWDAVPWNPAIHLAVFVHRVDGLQPGLYMLVRDPTQYEVLRAAMHDDFLWATPPGCPDDIPFFLLKAGDARRLATQVSCHQEIAGDSAFSLGMIAEFESSLRRYGAWYYRRLFWETGVIGQVLYLEAEAAGVRATGIG
ncbi:MAG: SagB family peptide dehydrogenase, partial [Nitrospiraceae bacterium]